MKPIGILTAVGNPAAETIDAAGIKLHVKEDLATEDALLALYATTVRQLAETFTGRSFVNATFEYRLDAWPCIDRDLGVPVLYLPRGNLVSVTHVKYIAPDGDHSTYTTLDSAEYVVDIYSKRPRIVPQTGSVFPPLKDTILAVLVTFVAGYGATSASVPEQIKTALKYAAAYLYENRVPPDSCALPEFVKDLLRPYSY